MEIFMLGFFITIMICALIDMIKKKKILNGLYMLNKIFEKMQKNTDEKRELFYETESLISNFAKKARKTKEYKMSAGLFPKKTFTTICGKRSKSVYIKMIYLQSNANADQILKIANIFMPIIDDCLKEEKDCGKVKNN